MTSVDVSVAPLSPAGLRPSAASALKPLACDVYTDLASAEPVWRALEADGTLSVFQQFDYLDAWSRTLGRDLTPFIVVLRDCERPLLLLPLCITRRGPLKAARFMGGSHANYALPVLAPGAGALLTAERLRAGLIAAAAKGPGIDAYVLTRLAHEWDRVANPLMLLNPSASACNGYAFALAPNFDDVLVASDGFKRRKRLRPKERKLLAAPGSGLRRPRDLAEALSVLDAFLEQKGKRLIAQGLPNMFAIPGTRAFFAELIRRSQGRDKPLFELMFIHDDAGAVLSTVGLCAHRDRLTLNTTSIGEHPLTTHSPGEVLIFRSIEEACARGFTAYDMGIGEERYKSSWNPDVLPQSDLVLPTTLVGRGYAAIIGLKLALKRLIRSSPWAWSLVKRWRQAATRKATPQVEVAED